MQPTFFINHGGGPGFYLEPGPMRSTWAELETHLRQFAASLALPPKALLLISAHWEERCPTVQASSTPSLLFDYSGFPEHTYRLTWPAPGSPSLAARVRELLAAAGINSAQNETRGWDHGVFVPLKLMFPQAHIPLVQLSLQQGLDPATHLAVGRALRPLRDEGVLIIGSGQSFHNMRAFSSQETRAAEAFDAWLRDTMPDAARREAALIDWEAAPGSRYAHPREEHLLPLMVAAGAASGEPGRIDFHGRAMGQPISGFRFG
jgi:aromatic ring-opening dioxygenase catalytic subunit (LigB family)